jgi:hypothetical protein
VCILGEPRRFGGIALNASQLRRSVFGPSKASRSLRAAIVRLQAPGWGTVADCLVRHKASPPQPGVRESAHSPATFLSKVGRSKAPVRMGIAEATLAAAATNEIICSNVGHRDAWCDASSHQWSRLRSLKGAGGLAICPGYGHEGRYQNQEAHVAHGTSLYLCAISTSASTTIAPITQSAR